MSKQYKQRAINHKADCSAFYLNSLEKLNNNAIAQNKKQKKNPTKSNIRKPPNIEEQSSNKLNTSHHSTGTKSRTSSSFPLSGSTIIISISYNL